MRKLLNEEAIKNIWNWKDTTTDPTKFQCVWLQKYKNIILKAQVLPAEKEDCFCASATRNKYYKAFYIWLDQNIEWLTK